MHRISLLGIRAKAQNRLTIPSHLLSMIANGCLRLRRSVSRAGAISYWIRSRRAGQSDVRRPGKSGNARRRGLSGTRLTSIFFRLTPNSTCGGRDRAIALIPPGCKTFITRVKGRGTSLAHLVLAGSGRPAPAATRSMFGGKSVPGGLGSPEVRPKTDGSARLAARGRTRVKAKSLFCVRQCSEERTRRISG